VAPNYRDLPLTLRTAPHIGVKKNSTNIPISFAQINASFKISMIVAAPFFFIVGSVYLFRFFQNNLSVRVHFNGKAVLSFYVGDLKSVFENF